LKKRNNVFSRVKAKTFEALLILKLTRDYCLSPVEANTLTQDLTDYIHNNSETILTEGEILFTAVVRDEPAGKPLNKCNTKQIKLNLYPPELIELFYKNLKKYHRLMVERLSWAVFIQGCCLTQEDLARLLHCSVSTIKRIIAQFRKQGNFIPTRGNYGDIGPGISHKAEAVKRYLKGYTVSEIALVMAHHPRSIERYLDDFCLVVSGYINESFSALRLSRSLKLSEKLVEQYIDLYHRFKKDPDCQQRLEQLLARINELFNRSKKNQRRMP